MPDAGVCGGRQRIMTGAPEVLHALLAHLADALVVYVCHQIDAGAQARPLKSTDVAPVRAPSTAHVCAGGYVRNADRSAGLQPGMMRGGQEEVAAGHGGEHMCSPCSPRLCSRQDFGSVHSLLWLIDAWLAACSADAIRMHAALNTCGQRRQAAPTSARCARGACCLAGQRVLTRGRRGCRWCSCSTRGRTTCRRTSTPSSACRMRSTSWRPCVPRAPACR